MRKLNARIPERDLLNDFHCEGITGDPLCKSGHLNAVEIVNKYPMPETAHFNSYKPD